MDIHIAVIAKGAERYVFIYDDAGTNDMLKRLGVFAMNPNLSFDWHDAARVSELVREPQCPS